MSSANDTSDSFQMRRTAARRLASEIRRVIERLVVVDAPAEDLERAAEVAKAFADRLDGMRQRRWYEGFAEAANAGSPSAFFDHSPIIGLANPLAPPIRVELVTFEESASEESPETTSSSNTSAPRAEGNGGSGYTESGPDNRSDQESASGVQVAAPQKGFPSGYAGLGARRTKVVGHVRYGYAYEGPPGCVHGGVLAAAFDEILGFAQSLSGRPGMTGTLTVRYRKPTPLNADLVFEGWVDRIEGRKIFTSGRCMAGDAVTAEAEGLFISVDFEKMAQLLKDRMARESSSKDPS